MKQNKVEPISAPRKGFYPQVKKVARLVGQVSAIVLSLPLKLPFKVVQFAQYLDTLANIVKSLGKGKNEQP